MPGGELRPQIGLVEKLPRLEERALHPSHEPLDGAGHLYVSGSDEHDEDGVLLSDVFTDPVRRKKMVDKRVRKMSTVLDHVPAPEFNGPADAEVTLVG